MAELINCPRCGSIYVENKFRDVCDKCNKDEDRLFREVYDFLRKRENRAASQERVMEVTGVTEDMLYKWVKKGRLQTRLFPNLGYPCDKCGKIISGGKLCESCSKDITNSLKNLEAQEDFAKKIRESQQGTYFTTNRDNK